MGCLFSIQFQMIENVDEIDKKIFVSLRRTMLRESDIFGLFQGKSLLHDLNVHPDTINEVLEQIVLDYEIDASNLNTRDYYFKFGGVDDFISPVRFLNPIKRYFLSKYKKIDIEFIRESIRSKRMPPQSL